MKLMGKLAQRAFRGCTALLALGLLASCGGGTEQITPFAPTRMLAFGDEMSVLTKEDPQGRKYSVNALDSSGTIDCAANTSTQPSWLWTQYLANTYQFVFEECNPLKLPVSAFSFAEPGARVDDFPAQVARARALTGSFSATDLASVLIGANDVLDVYKNQYVPDPAYASNFTQNPTYQAAITELRARGTRLGQAITALTDNGGPKVILSTIPMMNLTPYARQQAILHPEANVQTVLANFSNTFNTAVRTNIPNDGSRWGLVELDSMVDAGSNNPSTYGLTNVINSVCDPATWGTPDCNTSTLVPDGSATSWLWASDVWMGWRAHFYLGTYARGRALGNPF